MPRRHRDQTFRQTDVTGAYKAAQAAGIPNPQIEIDTITRVIRIVPGGASPNGSGTGNPWDEVLTNAKSAKRSA